MNTAFFVCMTALRQDTFNFAVPVNRNANELISIPEENHCFDSADRPNHPPIYGIIQIVTAAAVIPKIISAV